MKTFRSFIIWTLVLAVPFCFQDCKKNKPDIERLPPLTSTGENTFGCLIDGKIFLPRRQGLQASQQCYYQHIYEGDNGYVFVVKASYNKGCELRSVGIRLDSVKLIMNIKYPLTIEKMGTNSSSYLFGDCDNYSIAETNETHVGNLTITHFDETKHIVSGTFAIDLIDYNGKKYHITEGRFDQQFNQ